MQIILQGQQDSLRGFEGVLRLALNQRGIQIGSDDVILHSSPTSFDATTLEVWATLLNGGKIVVIKKQCFP